MVVRNYRDSFGLFEFYRHPVFAIGIGRFLFIVQQAVMFKYILGRDAIAPVVCTCIRMPVSNYPGTSPPHAGGACNGEQRG